MFACLHVSKTQRGGATGEKLFDTRTKPAKDADLLFFLYIIKAIADKDKVF